jgi:hypothetical protein
VRTKVLRLILVAGALLIAGALGWRFTFGNATWQIHRILPGALVYFDPVNSPDPSFSMLIRVVVPSYLERTEDISIELSDHRTPIDSHLLPSFVFTASISTAAQSPTYELLSRWVLSSRSTTATFPPYRQISAAYFGLPTPTHPTRNGS